MFSSMKIIVYILLAHFVLTNDAFNWNLIKEPIQIIKEWFSKKIEEFIPGNSFNKHAPYNIILIGQTGSGKTSLLNLLLNVNHIVSLKNSHQTMENLRLYNNISLEMKNDETGMNSKTSGCQAYLTKFGNYILRIVDTPGFGDSRGFDYDIKHTKSIIRAIEKLSYVHSIILVINGREARMTASLKYVLEQIFAIMPGKIQSNIVVVFTNVDDILNLNFNISSLSEYVRKDVNHYWLIENPICKLEKAQKKQEQYDFYQKLIVEKDMIDSLKQAFTRTELTIMNMYRTISNFQPIMSNEFQKLYNLKERIEQKYLALIVEHQQLMDESKNIQDFQDKIKLYQNRKIEAMDFNKSEIVEKTILEDTNEHNTLCAHEGCFHNCHLNCHLPMTLERGAGILKGCTAMDSTGLTCSVCGHSYKDHYHVKSKWVTKQEIKYYIDSSLQKKFNLAETNEEQANIAFKSTNFQLDQIKKNILKLQEELFDLLKEYEEIGLRKNYLALLQSQLNYAKMSIKNFHGSHQDDIYKGLIAWKRNLDIKIKFYAKESHTEL